MFFMNLIKMTSILAMLSMYTVLADHAKPMPMKENVPHAATVMTFPNGTEYITLYNGKQFILPYLPPHSKGKRQTSPNTPFPKNHVKCNPYTDYKRMPSSGIYKHIDDVCNTLKGKEIGPVFTSYATRTHNGVAMAWIFRGQTKKKILTFETCRTEARALQDNCSTLMTNTGAIRGWSGGFKVSSDGETYLWAEPGVW